MYTGEDAEREHKEWLEELSHTTHAELLARYLELSKQCDYLRGRLEARDLWLFLIGGALLMLVVYWLRIS